jgi:hypothetical protein
MTGDKPKARVAELRGGLDVVCSLPWCASRENEYVLRADLIQRLRKLGQGLQELHAMHWDCSCMSGAMSQEIVHFQVRGYSVQGGTRFVRTNFEEVEWRERGDRNDAEGWWSMQSEVW